jgi:adenylosuccinate lyase
MPLDPLLALSPLDGRYAGDVEPLRDLLSEFAFLRDRVGIEIAFLRALARETSLVRDLTPVEDGFLLSLLENFSSHDARRIKELERQTRHDVKAVEYFLREQLERTTLNDVAPFIHFGLTSEDVNQTALAVALAETRDEVLLPALDAISTRLKALALDYRALPMLARTHGQPAVPTTLGKEFANFYVRLRDLRRALAAHRFSAKLNGAVGNFNALAAAAPDVDWPAFASRLLESLGLAPAQHTTQLMPYDNWVRFFNDLCLANSILLDLARDVWYYISLDYLKQKVVSEQVGSSTMPHKVNPIDFENAEGNLEVANALLALYARKLPVSRLQRDLSDSTVRRTFGVALGHALVAWQAIARGLDRVEPDAGRLKADLDAHWEIVAEGAQTILRASGVRDAYEQLKTLTRGQTFSRDQYASWVQSLPVDDSTRARLAALTPETYIGLAAELAANLD